MRFENTMLLCADEYNVQYVDLPLSNHSEYIILATSLLERLFKFPATPPNNKGQEFKF